MAFKATDDQVKTLAKRFSDANDVLNSLWITGYRVEDLQKALATTDKGTNRTEDIIVRLLNSGVVKDAMTIGQAADLQPASDAYNWPFTKTGNGPLKPNHFEMSPTPSSGELPQHPQQTTGLRMPIPIQQPTVPKAPDLGQDKRTQTPAGGGAPATNTVIVRTEGTPPPKTPQSPAEIDKWVREKYGSYSWMLDDPNFAEVRKVLEDGARNGLDAQAIEAQIRNTNWWKGLDDNQRQFDIAEKTGGTTVQNWIGQTRNHLSAMASQLGITIDPGRLDAIARDAARNGWTDQNGNVRNELAIRGALVGEAAYKPDFGGDIGMYETKAKGIARDYLQPLSDEAAFEWAKQMAAGTADEDNLKAYFIQQAVGLLPQFQKQLEAGVTARTLLNPQINTVAQLLEMDPENVDLIGDTRLSGIISNPDNRVLSVAETSKVVKQTDDYWKTNNASKEVSSLTNSLARSFGRLA